MPELTFPAKRFWVFCFDHYYPSGGEGDCIGSFATKDEAINACQSQAGLWQYDLEYVLDTHTGEKHHLV